MKHLFHKFYKTGIIYYSMFIINKSMLFFSLVKSTDLNQNQMDGMGVMNGTNNTQPNITKIKDEIIKLLQGLNGPQSCPEISSVIGNNNNNAGSNIIVPGIGGNKNCKIVESLECDGGKPTNGANNNQIFGNNTNAPLNNNGAAMNLPNDNNILGSLLGGNNTTNNIPTFDLTGKPTPSTLQTLASSKPLTSGSFCGYGDCFKPEVKTPTMNIGGIEVPTSPHVEPTIKKCIKPTGCN